MKRIVRVGASGCATGSRRSGSGFWMVESGCRQALPRPGHSARWRWGNEVRGRSREMATAGAAVRPRGMRAWIACERRAAPTRCRGWISVTRCASGWCDTCDILRAFRADDAPQCLPCTGANALATPMRTIRWRLRSPMSSRRCGRRMRLPARFGSNGVHCAGFNPGSRRWIRQWNGHARYRAWPSRHRGIMVFRSSRPGERIRPTHQCPVVTRRPCRACTGRRLPPGNSCPEKRWVNAASCAIDAVLRTLATCQATPSLHGGVVSEPAKR